MSHSMVSIIYIYIGLDKDELGVLSKYVHFRNAQSEEKKQFIEKGDAIFYNNFLDPIEEDQPRGTWSIHLDSSKTLVIYIYIYIIIIGDN